MSDLSIQRAIAEIILGVSRPDRTTVVPQATLTAPAGAGDIAMTCDDLSRFTKTGTFDWWDWRDGSVAREPARGILDITDDVLTIDYRGLPAGLTNDHVAGALIATNLLQYDPSEVGQYLIKDDTLTLVYCHRQADTDDAMRWTIPYYTVHVECVRQTVQRAGEQMHPNVYAEMQQDATRVDLELIKVALLANRNLVTSQGPQAINLGDETTRPLIVREWVRLIDRDKDVDRFIAGMDVLVMGAQEPTGARP